MSATSLSSKLSFGWFSSPGLVPGARISSPFHLGVFRWRGGTRLKKVSMAHKEHEAIVS